MLAPITPVPIQPIRVVPGWAGAVGDVTDRNLTGTAPRKLYRLRLRRHHQ